MPVSAAPMANVVTIVTIKTKEEALVPRFSNSATAGLARMSASVKARPSAAPIVACVINLMTPVAESRLGTLFGDFFARMELPSIGMQNARGGRGFHSMKDFSTAASSGVHAQFERMNVVNTGMFAMGKVVFLYRSLAYRNAAADMLRKARKLPRGAERSAARRYATALRDLAQTEAWLEGRVADEPRPMLRLKVVASR